MWIDVIILAVIVICVMAGAKKGLVLSLVSALSLVIAIAVAYLFVGPVSSVIEGTSIPGKISASVSGVLEKGADAIENSADVTSKEILSNSKLPDFIIGKLSGIKIGSSLSGSFDDMAGEIGDKAASIATKAVAFLIVFLIVYIALAILRLLWKGLRNIQFVKEVDTWGGVIFGLAEGVLIVTAAMLLICTVCASGHWQGLADTIGNTFLAKFLYEKNFLGAIIASL